MRAQPGFFSRIEDEARGRWDLLEGDPDIAAPWWQLFRQVKSPQHVLSELLQNADDAGATWAACRVEGGEFVFEHDGRDFSEAEFRALCAFGRSSKTKTFTIGFRGIGFKSVFSLGDEVVLETPSLSVRFSSSRFTQPTWVGDAAPAAHTRVSTRFSTEQLEHLMLRQLAEWASNPLPLLFFRSVQELRIGSTVVGVETGGPGPIPDSTWVTLNGRESRELLVIRSGEHEAPAEALAEVREERGDPELTLPPLEITLVADRSRLLEGQLYSVLPAGTNYPGCVAVQAPFMQNPGRTQLKDPASSPLNTWLLRRAAALAATSMVGWLGNAALSLEERADAYVLLPTRESTPATVAGSVARIVNEMVGIVLRNEAAVLRATGLLSKADVLCMPSSLLDVWTEKELLDSGLEASGVLSPLVSNEAVQSLVSWGVAAQLAKWDLTRALDALEPPAPRVPLSIVRYWEFRASLSSYVDWSRLKAVPADDGLLHSGPDLLLARSSSQAIEPDDWDFLLSFVCTPEASVSKLLIQLDDSPAMAQQLLSSELAEEFSDARMSTLRDLAKKMSLGQSADTERVVSIAARRVFGGADDTESMIQLVAIAARAGVRLVDDGEVTVTLLCADGAMRSRGDGLLAEDNDGLAALLPSGWRVEHIVAPVYADSVGSRTWLEWALDPNRGMLYGFPRPVPVTQSVWRLDDFAREHAVKPGTLRFKNQRFSITDYDWPQELLAAWSDDEDSWIEVTRQLLADWKARDNRLLTSSVEQLSQANTRALVPFDCEPKSAWVMRLAGQRCLVDEYGESKVPVELLRRTPETDALRGLEHFVEAAVDRSETTLLLATLGVGSEPASQDRLVERLHALSASGEPLIVPARDLYRVLERLSSANPEMIGELEASFRGSSLLISDDGVWRSSEDLFVRNPRQIPGMHAIHHELDGLDALWRRLQLREVPSTEDAIEWVVSLPVEEALPAADQQSVEAVCAEAPDEVWAAGVWLNLNGMLREVGDFKWAALSAAPDWSLFFDVAQEIADLRFVDRAPASDDCRELRCVEECVLVVLAAEPDISERVEPDVLAPLHALGGLLMKARLHDEFGDEWRQDRRVAEAISRMSWIVSRRIEIEPRLDGVQVGPANQVDAFWDLSSATLYTLGRGFGVYEAAVGAISRSFASGAARAALHACWLRPESSSQQYLSEVLGFADIPAAVDEDPDTERAVDGASGQGVPLDMPSEADASFEPSADQEQPYRQALDSLETGNLDQAAVDQDAEVEQPEKTASSVSRWRRVLESLGFTETRSGFSHPTWGELSEAGHSSTIFKWRLTHPSTRVDGYAVVADTSLNAGLTLKAEQWAWGNAHPDETWVVDPERGVLTFSELLRLKEAGELRVHAERYRLVAE